MWRWSALTSENSLSGNSKLIVHEALGDVQALYCFIRNKRVIFATTPLQHNKNRLHGGIRY
jgi:hypothetical protein